MSGLQKDLALLLGLVTLSVAAARLSDPVGPPLRTRSPQSVSLLARSATCGDGAVVSAAGVKAPLDARPAADGGALAWSALDLDIVNHIDIGPLTRLDPTPRGGAAPTTLGRLDLAGTGVGPVWTALVARGWPRPGTALCLYVEAPWRGTLADGGLLVGDDGRAATWSPHFGRMNPVSTGGRIAYHLEDLWWLALVAVVLALAPAVGRRRSSASVLGFGPVLGAALAVVFASGL